MKQPEDTRTIDLLDGLKRGRGRPPVANPLSPAERARRYRARKAAQLRMATGVTKISRDDSPVTEKDDRVARLDLEIQKLGRELESYRQFAQQRAGAGKKAQAEYDALRLELDASQRRIADLTGALDEVVLLASSGKRIPAQILKGLVVLLADV